MELVCMGSVCIPINPCLVCKNGSGTVIMAYDESAFGSEIEYWSFHAQRHYLLNWSINVLSFFQVLTGILICALNII